MPSATVSVRGKVLSRHFFVCARTSAYAPEMSVCGMSSGSFVPLTTYKLIACHEATSISKGLEAVSGLNGVQAFLSVWEAVAVVKGISGVLSGELSSEFYIMTLKIGR